MSTARALFPGAMGPDGFISCFDHLIPEQHLQKKLILKGGPGVGKSTFMRRLHAALCKENDDCTLYFCSGDPDSLDAVAFSQSGLLILDGTAPHMVDPHVPGARDSLINLGVCLNEDAMRPRLTHIRACMADHAAASRRARAYMKAACSIEQDCASLIAGAVDSGKFARMTQAVCQAILLANASRDVQATIRPVITDALTPKGMLCLLSDGAQEHVIRLTGPDSMDLTDVLSAVCQAALGAGYAIEKHLSALVPGRLLHVTIPALSMLITTSEKLPAELTFDYTACVSSGSLLRHECALEQGRCSVHQLLKRAASAMDQAHQLHDELETFYVPNMDFDRWQKIYDDTLNTLTKA